MKRARFNAIYIQLSEFTNCKLVYDAIIRAILNKHNHRAVCNIFGKTCGRSKKGLVQPLKREEQARCIYCENARFQKVLWDKYIKIGNLTNPDFFLNNWTWTCGLYNPNEFFIVFLAIYSFFSAFLSGKSAFPCSRVLLCPYCPYVSMVWICGQASTSNIMLPGKPLRQENWPVQRLFCILSFDRMSYMDVTPFNICTA